MLPTCVECQEFGQAIHTEPKTALAAYCKQHKLQPIWFEDYASGYRARRRNGLQDLLEVIQGGDTILISELSRLSRGTITETLKLVESLVKRGINLVCLTPAFKFDSTAQSELLLSIFSYIARMESEHRSVRIKQGIQALRERKPDVRLGRAFDHKKREKVREWRKTMTVDEIAKRLDCGRRHVFHLLAS